MGTALDAHDAALTFLDAAADSLDTLTADGLAGAPTVQYVHTGTPAIDCEQLVVWLSDAAEQAIAPNANTLEAGTRGVHGRVNYVAATVMIARCVPTVTQDKAGRNVVPSADAFTAAARQTNADLWAIWNGLNVARKRGRFDGTCGSVAFGQATALLTTGGFGGWQVPLLISLDGYRPDIGV